MFIKSVNNVKDTIIIVDDSNISRKMCRNILEDKYKVISLASVEKLFDVLKQKIPVLIILDILMPGIDGFSALKLLQMYDEYRNIPVIFITSDTDIETEVKGLMAGAVDFIKKPIDPDVLLGHVILRINLSRKEEELRQLNKYIIESSEHKDRRIESLRTNILNIVSELIECRDLTTGTHVMNTQRYLETMVNRMVLTHRFEAELIEWSPYVLLFSAQLHDIGKIGIPDAILNKPAKLTKEEYEEIKKHVMIGVNIIDKMIDITGDMEFLQPSKMFAEFHHERWDGKGYPKGLSGRDIPFEGRLMCIADVYDAITSERPYKKASTHSQAFKIINEGNGIFFDPEIVDIFNECADEFKYILEDIEINTMIYEPIEDEEGN